MQAIQLAEAGKVLRTHGVDGTLHLLFQQKTQELSQGEALFLWYRGNRVPFFIEDLIVLDEGELLVKLEDLHSREAAKVFVNHPFWIKASLLSETNTVDEPWVGWLAIDAEGSTVGIIQEVMDMGEYLLLTILHHDREVLVPLHEALLIGVDEAAGVVQLTIPEGLLDIEE